MTREIKYNPHDTIDIEIDYTDNEIIIETEIEPEHIP